MSSLTRIAWCVPWLVAACGSTSVRDDSSDDGGDHRSNGGVRGEGGSTGFQDGGVAAGGYPGSGGSTLGSGGFFRGDGGFFGGDGAFPGAGGFFPGSGGFFGGDGAFPGAGGFFGAGGDYFAGGGFFGSGGAIPAAGGIFGSGGRLVDPACCEAIPFCRAGYDQVSGPGECNPGDICYESTACCSTIWCKALRVDQDAGACAAEAPPGVRYVSTNASVCDRRAWTCPANTYQYWDTCACGCSQDPGCPASVDCKAAPNDAICTDDATCPYTKRVR